MILDAHPDLHAGGYGGDYSDRDHRELRSEQSQALVFQVAATFRYFPPGPRELRTRNSYGFKHDAEKHLQGYVANGQAIAAFLSLGYQLAGDSGYNATFYYPGCSCEDEACGLCAERVISCDCPGAVCEVCEDGSCPDAICPECQAAEAARMYPGCAACKSHQDASSWDSATQVQAYRERWEQAARKLSPGALAYARLWEKRFAKDPRYARFAVCADLVGRVREEARKKGFADYRRLSSWDEAQRIAAALGVSDTYLWIVEQETRR